MKLFEVLIGCLPKGRHIEQHDIFFCVGETIQDIIPKAKLFWPEGADEMHFDGYRILEQIQGYDINLVPKNIEIKNDVQLFFINLGGYKPEEFEEFHYKMVVATPDKASAIQQAKQTAFYKHTGFKGAESHIDDKYGIDIDEIYALDEILNVADKNKYSLKLTKATTIKENKMELGYLSFKKLLSM